jgi:hypothetical protein
MVIINALVIVVMFAGLLPLFSGIGLLLNGRGTAIRQDGTYQVDGSKARLLGAGHLLMGIISVVPGIGGLLGVIDTSQVSVWLYTFGPVAILFLSWLVADRLPGNAVKQTLSKVDP